MRNLFLVFGALLLLLINFIAQNFVYILGGVAVIFFLACIAGIEKRKNDEKRNPDTDIIKCRLCQKQISGFSGVGFPDSDTIELLRKYGRKTGNICRSCAGAKMAKLEKDMAPYIKRGEPFPEPKVASLENTPREPQKEIVIHLDFTGMYPDLEDNAKRVKPRQSPEIVNDEAANTLPSKLLTDSDDIIFIDFETATCARDSACSIGIVHTSKGKIVEKNQWLIRPPDNIYDAFNIQIHGITPKMTRDEPTFGELWPEIEKYFRGTILAAHNASFDMSGLRYSLDRYGIQYPDCKYFCTLVMARACLPDRPSHKLDWLCSEFKISFQHHDAGEDAFAAFEVCKRLLAISGKDSLHGFFEKYNISFGNISPKANKGCSKRTPAKLYSTFKPETETNPSHPCFGKRFMITGKLESMARDAAAQRIVNVGGEISNSFSKKVSYLVVGNFEFSRLKDGEKSSKFHKVEEAIKNGQEIAILSENEFLTLLDTDLA